MHPLHRSLLAAATLALALPAAARQAYPGTPRSRSIPVAANPQAPPTRVTVADLYPDGRPDAAIVAGGGLGLVLAIHGMPTPTVLELPAQGAVSDAIALDRANAADELWVVVSGGPTPGLARAAVELVDGEPNLRTVGTPLGTWADVSRLAVWEEGEQVEIAGLVGSLGIVRRATSTAGGLVEGPAIVLHAPASDIRAASYRDPAGVDLLVHVGDSVQVRDPSDGTSLATVTATAPIRSYAVAYDPVSQRSLLAAVTRAAGAAWSYLEVFPANAPAEAPLALGVGHPRVTLGSILAGGAPDLVAVHTNGPTGFIAFAHVGPGPGTYALTQGAAQAFLFDAPSYPGGPVASDPVTADLDLDGDEDVLLLDPAGNLVHEQPNWLIDEIAAAPAVTQVIPYYRHATVSFQEFFIDYALPAETQIDPLSVVEVALWQITEEAEGSIHTYVGGGVFPVSAVGALPDGRIEYSTPTPVGSHAVYSGPEATDADYVAALRLLTPDPADPGRWRFGVESFTAFHHTRTPNPYLPGTYGTGTAGGQTPLPGSVTGQGRGTPPVPPPPSGG